MTRRFEDLTLGELDAALADLPDADVWIRCRGGQGGEGVGIVLRIGDHVIDAKTNLCDALRRMYEKRKP